MIEPVGPRLPEQGYSNVTVTVTATRYSVTVGGSENAPARRSRRYFLLIKTPEFAIFFC